MSEDEDIEIEEEDEDDFGGAELEAPDLPPAPAASAKASSAAGVATAHKPEPPPPEFLAFAKELRDLGPTKRLEQGSLMFDILQASMADTLVDGNLSAVERRRELRTIAAAAAKVFPLKELHEATAKIDAFNAQIEKRAGSRGAEMEDAPKVARAAKVIPIRGTAVPGGKS